MPEAVFLLGGTGTIGRATAAALVAAGHEVTALVRRADQRLPGCRLILGEATSASAMGQAMQGAGAVISCLASRTGSRAEAWAVDHGANSLALRAAQEAGVRRFVLLSAICVQRPKLEFQRAKLAFETALQESGLDWTIIRPTAFFKSLSGQVARVQAGKPFLVFGDGRVTACKPISDADLARFIAARLVDRESHGCILPIGGPGPAITPLHQAALLEGLLGRPVPIRRVPLALMDGIVGVLSQLGRLSPHLADKAEFARIGRYYASESMLVWDATCQTYSAEMTPETGQDRLEDHYAGLLSGAVPDDRGAHAVF